MIAIIGILVAVAIPVFVALQEQGLEAAQQERDLTGETLPTPVEPPPAPSPPREPINVPWELLIFGGLSLSLVSAGISGGSAANRRRRSRLEISETRTAKWVKAQTTHAEIANAYADLRLDPISAIDHMALWDVTDPVTAEFTRTYGKVTDLGMLSQQKVPTTDEVVTEYVDAVAAAKISWDAAVAHAKLKGTECLPATERADADRARKLLVRSRNAGASEAERALAADRASELLSNLRKVIMPDEMRFEIEATKRLALPSVGQKI